MPAKKQTPTEPAQDSTTAPESLPETAPKSELDQLLALRAQRQDQVSAVQGQIRELQDEERRLYAELDRLQARIERLQPEDSNAVAIQAYLARQTADRKAASARVRELYEMGVDPSELAPRRSPIDQAIASKRPRGNSGIRGGVA